MTTASEREAGQTPENGKPSLPKHLYRIRALKWAAAEIERQEIFFAHPATLNDPIEGLRDVLWQGDGIVWTNLIKHYLVCLNIAWGWFAILGETAPLEWRHIPIFQPNGPALIPPMKAIHDDIFREFFSVPEVSAVVAALAARKHPVRRAELTAYLRYLHMFAVTVIHRYHERHNPNPVEEVQQNLRTALAEAPRIIAGSEKLASERPDDPALLDAFFNAHNQLVAQLDLINQYNHLIDPEKKNRNFVFLGFPNGYVDQVCGLIYSEWYAACFLEDCKNSSVWGNYGDNHAGICLKFKTLEREGRPLIRLNRVCGLNSGGPTRGTLVHEFHPVVYGAKLAEIDFFGSIARLPIPTLRQHWYADGNGNRSPCGDTIFSSDSAWRAAHLDNFVRSITTKSLDWEYEREWRLLLHGDLDYSNDTDRKATFDFADLSGVIFGIRTPLDVKLEISKIIETKCRKAGRTDFKFYQAFYNHRTGTIDHSEMGLLKFAE